MAKSIDTKKIFDAAKAASEEAEADIVILNGDIERGVDNRFILQVRKRKKNKRLILLLVTPGGDADAAYRIARCAQDNYESFSVFVPGYCKSAGTLCVLGANDIIMSAQGELGPLDVQVYKRDELGEMSSGLVIGEALGKLQQHAFSMFETYFLAIKERSGGQVTLKTATDTASKMVIGLFQPIYCQIDPSALGDIERSMTIASDYGERLKLRSGNFTSGTLDKLVRSYSSHGFVIDRREAESLFTSVVDPTEKQETLARLLAPASRVPQDELTLEFLYPNDELEEKFKEKSNDAEPDQGAPATADSSAGASTEVGAGSDGGNSGQADQPPTSPGPAEHAKDDLRKT
jgi:Serine dehydrogenase proteinase